VREVPVEEAMRVSSGSDVADVLESVEIAIVGPVATYVGGTNANWVEDETVDRVQRDQVARAIHAFADALAETEKTIFKEHFLAGVRVADVAAKLSISVRTVERMLKALRERLREHLLRNVLA
jgi:RNA polymerase sigma factor (sigma-70 family)